MNDKPTAKIPGTTPASSAQLETQWVMVFNLITGLGKEEQKKTFKVNKKRLVIGSALSSDIRIQQNAVSNVHAVVEMDDNGQARIYDMASETGVFINDRKELSADLKDGDEVKVGFATLTYKRMAVSEAQAAVPQGSVRSSGARKLFLDAKEDFRPLILEDERNVIQIFDYPSSGEQALQVVMYWSDVILDVKHITEQKTVTLGEDRKATFAVPGMHSDFPFISFDNGVTLQVNAEMKGVVRSGNKLTPLHEIPGNRFQLKQADQAKIQFRDVTFFVSYSPLPPHLRRQKILERDGFFTRIWFTSLALTSALVVLALGITPEKPLEVDELPPRVATVIFKPVPPPPPPPKPVEPPKKVEPPKVEEKKPEPPKPKPPKKVEPPKQLPKEVKPPKEAPKQVTKPTEKPVQAANQVKGQPAKPAGGNEGEGKRAPGPEGRKGEPNKPKSPVGQVATRGNPNVNKPVKSEAQGRGNVEALFDNISGAISKNMAASGAGANAAGARLKGYGGFTTEGNGGLGNLGAGTGGGGESESLTAGLGTKGLGSGAKGNGIGAIGSGGNLLGTGHGRPSIEVGNATETIIMGGLDKSVIDEIIKRHMAQIRYCYSKELDASKGNLSGRILTRFVISGSGTVTQSGVESSSIGNANVEKCLTGVLKRIVFPEPVGGSIVEVSYPFSFTPSVSGG